MKKIIIVIYLSLILFICFGCKHVTEMFEVGDTSNIDILDSEDIYMTATPEYDGIEWNIEVEIINNSDETTYFGSDIILEYEYDNEWHSLILSEEVAIEEGLCTLKPNEVFNDTNTLVIYGDILYAGNYRAIKEISIGSMDNKYYIASEFQLSGEGTVAYGTSS